MEGIVGRKVDTPVRPSKEFGMFWGKEGACVLFIAPHWPLGTVELLTGRQVQMKVLRTELRLKNEQRSCWYPAQRRKAQCTGLNRCFQIQEGYLTAFKCRWLADEGSAGPSYRYKMRRTPRWAYEPSDSGVPSAQGRGNNNLSVPFHSYLQHQNSWLSEDCLLKQISWKQLKQVIRFWKFLKAKDNHQTPLIKMRWAHARFFNPEKQFYFKYLTTSILVKWHSWHPHDSAGDYTLHSLHRRDFHTD